MTFFLSAGEVALLGLGTCGKHVLIDRSVRLINPQWIHLGHRVRIDAQVILSAGPDGLRLGNYTHLGASAMIFGGGGQVILEDFAGVSAGGMLYTVCDDFLEGHLTNPTVPEEFRKVAKGSVIFRRHSGIGAGSIVLPGVELGFGCVVGALTVVERSVPECAIVHGRPARQATRQRSRALLERLERELYQKYGDPSADRP